MRRTIRRKRRMKSMSVMKDTVLIKEAKNEKHCAYWAVTDAV
jgi:hypothetical protein